MLRMTDFARDVVIDVPVENCLQIRWHQENEWSDAACRFQRPPAWPTLRCLDIGEAQPREQPVDFARIRARKLLVVVGRRCSVSPDAAQPVDDGLQSGLIGAACHDAADCCASGFAIRSAPDSRTPIWSASSALSHLWLITSVVSPSVLRNR